MGKIFNKTKKEGAVTASAPVEPETQAEVDYTKSLSEDKPVEQQPVVETTDQPTVQHIEVPVCMSQTQINNMIIDNNMMLKHIISKLEE
ncbi:unnamed protein product [marine sediment metagenome]|uniref:Uncharacterized protein n=1 Tax=marine sediment metagenome TaxID=412755 RepID=X0VJ21_9ZZZZ